MALWRKRPGAADEVISAGDGADASGAADSRLVLVTFCNTVASPVCSFALVDLATQYVRRLSFDYDRETDYGATGITTLHDGSLALALPGSKRLLRLGPELESLSQYRDDAFADLHSLTTCGDSLYVASTGRDTILELQVMTDTFEARDVHRLSDALDDTLHVNSACFYRGELIASIFGDSWRDQPVGAPVGAVVSLATGEHLWTGFRHPHTLTVHEGTLFALDSYSGQVERLEGGAKRTVVAKFDGYLRGLAVLSDGYVVGLSAQRLRSRGLGTVNEGLGTALNRGSGLLVYSDNWDLLEMVDLSWFGQEIYDVMACPAGIAAPTVEDTLEAAKARSEQLQLTWQVPPGGAVPPPPSGRLWETSQGRRLSDVEDAT